MALVPYRRRTFDTAFGAPAGPLSRNVRSRYTMTPGYARGSISRRGNRYGRSTAFRGPFSFRSTHTNPVYPRPEVKALDVSSTTASIDNATGLVTSLNSIPVGTGPTQRIGNQVSIKSIYYQYVLNFGTGPVPNAIRHLVVWDRQSNGAAALMNQVLTAGSDFLVAPLSLAYRDRFTVLVDERTTLSPNGDQIRFCSGFRKINQRCDFIGNPIPTTGNLFSIFVSDETVVANEPTVYFTYRVRFIDN